MLILDIDSTLVNTHHRNQAIVEEFCLEMAQDFPEDIAQLRQVDCQLNDYGYYSALKRHDVQFSSAKAKQALQDFWRPRFFHSDYLHHDTEVPGAVDFVRTIHNKKLPYVFLTGRYKEPMLSGTFASLKRLGFPVHEDQLILKPNPAEPDADYKAREVQQQVSAFEQVTLIDNEPVILQRVAKDFPKVQLVWFDSTHSGKATPPENAPTIKDFLL